MACPCSLRKSPKFASQTSSLEFDYLASHWITMDHHWISLDLIEPHWMIQSEFHWIALDSTSTLNHLLDYPMKLSWTIYRNGIPLRPTMRLIMRLLPCTMLFLPFTGRYCSLYLFCLLLSLGLSLGLSYCWFAFRSLLVFAILPIRPAERATENIEKA